MTLYRGTQKSYWTSVLFIKEEILVFTQDHNRQRMRAASASPIFPIYQQRALLWWPDPSLNCLDEANNSRIISSVVKNDLCKQLVCTEPM